MLQVSQAHTVHVRSANRKRPRRDKPSRSTETGAAATRAMLAMYLYAAVRSSPVVLDPSDPDSLSGEVCAKGAWREP